MRKDDRVYVGHMLDMAKKAALKIQGRKQEECELDEDFCIVLAHYVQTFGEAARHVSVATQTAYPDIPWEKIIGTRHKIVHDYLSVDYGVVLGVVFRELQPLIPILENCLAKL